MKNSLIAILLAIAVFLVLAVSYASGFNHAYSFSLNQQVLYAKSQERLVSHIYDLLQCGEKEKALEASRMVANGASIFANSINEEVKPSLLWLVTEPSFYMHPEHYFFIPESNQNLVSDCITK